MSYELKHDTRLVWYMILYGRRDPDLCYKVQSLATRITATIGEFRQRVVDLNHETLSGEKPEQLYVYPNYQSFALSEDDALLKADLVYDLGLRMAEPAIVYISQLADDDEDGGKPDNVGVQHVEAKLKLNYEIPSVSDPTIADFLRAKDGEEGIDWKFRLASKTETRFSGPLGVPYLIRAGQPLKREGLRDALRWVDWGLIEYAVWLQESGASFTWKLSKDIRKISLKF